MVAAASHMGVMAASDVRASIATVVTASNVDASVSVEMAAPEVTTAETANMRATKMSAAETAHMCAPKVSAAAPATMCGVEPARVTTSVAAVASQNVIGSKGYCRAKCYCCGEYLDGSAEHRAHSYGNHT